MATGTVIAGSRSEHRGLAYWMERVLDELDKVEAAPADLDAVHDLRVAIRRCRSVAAVMEEVDPHASWNEMRRYPRKLFRALGQLRDTQVLGEWVRKLSTDGDLIRERLLAELTKRKKSTSRNRAVWRRNSTLKPGKSTYGNCEAARNSCQTIASRQNVWRSSDWKRPNFCTPERCGRQSPRHGMNYGLV